ncbi:MAG: hypothetical protein IKI31_01075, partial [Treponema sp.]|nr:hypothetical protein [Treponema sp.]
RYSDEDLKKFLEMLTTKTENSELPNLLVFKVASGTRYFIYKTKVFPLIIRLCNEAHDNVMNNLTAEWHNTLQNYKHLPEMSDKQRFESVLEDQVIKYSPVLYALLTANFLALLNIELYNSTESEIFKDGRVRPYSELLILNSNDILSNAKVTLPLWHSIPLLSKIIGFFAKLRKNKVNTDKVPGLIQQEDQSTKKRTLSKREALADTARTLSSHFVPEGSTIDRELDAYCKQWNKLITKEAHAQLTEDVNALIRDYMRKVINTISAQTFTADRIETLANALCRTPNMQKITEHEALFMYVQLYILRLVSNG